MLWVMGGIFSFITPALGIPFLIALFCIGGLLIWKAHSDQPITAAIFCVLFSVVILSVWHGCSIQPSTVDTKQAIRTLLESINPEILRGIDAGQKKILVGIGTTDVVKLLNLSERVDFDKYLSFGEALSEDDFKGLDDPNIFIESDVGLMWVRSYYLHPKDALIK